MKRYIGGFLELELFPQPSNSYHATAIGLQNARACISHIIRQTNMKAVWLPYYTCNALLQPFELANIPFHFYDMNQQLELEQLPELGPDEYLLYINYYGLKTAYVHQMLDIYSDTILVDNTQDYFAQGYGVGWSFNSARKSFGVPDGGYLYGPPAKLGSAANYPENTRYHAQHLIDRLRGKQSESYQGFIEYERTLNSEPLQISAFSKSLLSQIDYATVVSRRRSNFMRYHAALKDLNTLSLDLDLENMSSAVVPFCYPFVPANGAQIDRRGLFAEGVFVAQLWPDVLSRQNEGFAWERELTRALLPLPVDHRYNSADIDYVIQVTCELVSKVK